MRLKYLFRADTSRALRATPKRMFWSLVPIAAILIPALIWSAALPGWVWSVLVVLEVVVVSIVGSRLAESDALTAEAAESPESSDADE
jgi:hypothetical protein